MSHDSSAPLFGTAPPDGPCPARTIPLESRTPRIAARFLLPGILGVLASLLGACPYGPTIVETPITPEQPIFFDRQDVTPPADRPVIVDLSEEGDVTFSLTSVYLASPGVDPRYRWVYRTPEIEGVIDLGGGSLTPRPEQERAEVTAYEGVSITLRRCAFQPLLPDAPPLVLRLELTNQIPPDQRALPELREFETAINWSVIVRGDCPDD